MNELTAKYASQGLQVLGFPCNQFGMQENMGNGDILNILKYVRAGNNFVPTFQMFQKVAVNGATADPLFAWLRSKLPRPADDVAGTMLLVPNQMYALWAPITRTDMEWNFSKFLLGRNGLPIKRWSPDVASTDAGLVDDLVKALNNKTEEISPHHVKQQVLQQREL